MEEVVKSAVGSMYFGAQHLQSPGMYANVVYSCVSKLVLTPYVNVSNSNVNYYEGLTILNVRSFPLSDRFSWRWYSTPTSAM